MATMTLNQFAKTLGQHARVTRAHSFDWHVAYLKADKATQQAWRADFVVHYVEGYLDITTKAAQNVCAMARTERDSEQQRAVAAGRMMFKYHVERPENNKANKTEAQPRYRAPNGLKSAILPLIEAYGREALLAYLKAHK